MQKFIKKNGARNIGEEDVGGFFERWVAMHQLEDRWREQEKDYDADENTCCQVPKISRNTSDANDIINTEDETCEDYLGDHEVKTG